MILFWSIIMVGIIQIWNFSSDQIRDPRTRKIGEFRTNSDRMVPGPSGSFIPGADTDIYHSCSAPLNGEYYVFGGYNQAPWPEYDFRKQIRRDFKLIQY